MSMAAEERTVKWCRCPAREEAMASQTFRRSAAFGGWVLYDVPTRSMSKSARYWAFVDRSEYSHHDHTGEPFVWECCPFCGLDLPIVEGEDRPRPTSQSDGANPEE